MNRVSQKLYLTLKFQVLTRLLLLRKRFYAVLGRRSERDKLMVNIGGGLFFRPYWVVLDYISPYYPFAKKYIDHNVDLMGCSRFPFADNSVDVFYSAHTFEHIPQEFVPAALSEIHRSLRPGGVVRINVPDYDRLRAAAESADRTYLANQIRMGLSFEQAVVEQIATEVLERIPAESIAGDYAELDPEGFAERYCGMASRDVQKEKGGYHINWFNYDKLERLLREAGFATVYRSAPQASRFPELRGRGGWMSATGLFEVERMLGIDTTISEKSVYAEAVK